MNLEEQFDSYMETVHARRGSITAEQLDEVRCAFYTGAYLAYTQKVDYTADLLAFINELKKRQVRVH